MKTSIDGFSRRRAGVLLHPTSLPGSLRCGSLGRNALQFIEFLATAGFSVWQMLPVGPTGPGDSPYQSGSVHAGNPRLIDLEWLQQRGWLHENWHLATTDAERWQIFSQSWHIFNAQATPADRAAFEDFVVKHVWLEDYALFQALHLEFNRGWWEWPAELRNREPPSLAAASRNLADVIAVLKFAQFVFATQWQELREFAKHKSVVLFGDMPIFVAHDSAEVWARREYFDLNSDGTTRVVAGVPPDYFSATGQRWGNPLYLWEVMRQDGFTFWIERIHSQLELFDLLRIDHFRGFEAYWEIPAAEPNAVRGRWVAADGDALFTRLHEVFGNLPVVAEDLGIITPEVEALKSRHALPGMKVLQFAFSGGPSNPYLPFNYTVDSVVYTGTHDNDTTLGWYRALNHNDRSTVDDFLGWPQEPMPWPLIRLSLSSIAKLAIIPMQDLLELGSEQRMNLPGTIDGNWQWRFYWEQMPNALAGRMRHLIESYGRIANESY